MKVNIYFIQFETSDRHFSLEIKRHQNVSKLIPKTNEHYMGEKHDFFCFCAFRIDKLRKV